MHVYVSLISLTGKEFYNYMLGPIRTHGTLLWSVYNIAGDAN